jgi:hypothetical protein
MFQSVLFGVNIFAWKYVIPKLCIGEDSAAQKQSHPTTPFP